MAKVIAEEHGWMVRYWYTPDFVSYVMVDGEDNARREYTDKKNTYRRVELLEIDIHVMERSID